MHELIDDRYLKFFSEEITNWDSYFINAKTKQKPGVYCFCSKMSGGLIKLAYVGSSTNLYFRLKNHNILSNLIKEYNSIPNIYYKYCDNFFIEEIKIIKKYKPILNKLRYEQYIMD